MYSLYNYIILYIYIIYNTPDIKWFHGFPFRFRLYYLKWFGVYPRIAVHLLFIALLVTRCCGHNSQWVLASLFVICAAVRAMEVFTVWK